MQVTDVMLHTAMEKAEREGLTPRFMISEDTYARTWNALKSVLEAALAVSPNEFPTDTLALRAALNEYSLESNPSGVATVTTLYADKALAELPVPLPVAKATSLEARLAELASNYRVGTLDPDFAAEFGGIGELRSSLFTLVEEWETVSFEEPRQEELVLG